MYARNRVLEELKLLCSANYRVQGLPWNSFNWHSEVTKKVTELAGAAVISTEDIRFSPRGVVMKTTTTDGVYFLKACHPSSPEPAVVEIVSERMAMICDVARFVDCSLGLILSKDHGPSIIPCLDLQVEKKSATCLAEFQFASVSLVQGLLTRGVLDARPSNFGGFTLKIEKHPTLRWIENLGNVSFKATRKIRKYLEVLTAKLQECACSLGDLPPVLLHNDIASGNLFRSDNGALKLFDFGFSAIGHPFMDFSFRLLSLGARKAFAEAWSVQCFDCTDMIPMIRRLTLPAYVTRLLQVLDSYEGARDSEKLEVAPLVEDLCDMILMILPGEAHNAESTVSY